MKKYRSAVSVLVVRGKEHEVLLVHKPRKRDAWQLPQGGVEEGETIGAAALRELEEETGLSGCSVRHVSARTYRYDFPPDYVERHHPTSDGQSLSFVVVSLPADAAVKVDNEEIDDFRWAAPAELGEFIKREEYLEVVRSVLGEFEKVLSRE